MTHKQLKALGFRPAYYQRKPQGFMERKLKCKFLKGAHISVSDRGYILWSKDIETGYLAYLKSGKATKASLTKLIKQLESV